jgi:hypothetical protein
MYTSLGQAAKAAGVSRSAILRAIRAHRISAGKIDPPCLVLLRWIGSA